MKKSVAILGNQIQEKCLQAQELVSELDLGDHPLSATISELTTQTQKLIALLGTDSTNSHLPPSQDPPREKKSKAKEKRKPGGQCGHKGTRLVPFKSPDEVITLEISKDQLPAGAVLIGHQRRQVVQLKTHRHIVEYQAHVYRLIDGTEIMAVFPEGATSDIQYGQSIKAFVAYASAYQLMPYRRIVNLLSDQFRIPVSEGSVYNFLKEIYSRLSDFERWLCHALLRSPVVHADETSININGKNHWIHTLSNEFLTLLAPHQKRGCEAIEKMGILPKYSGIVCHDCWSSYFAYDNATHVLCNAHIMPELKGAEEKFNCRWARLMHALFLAMHKLWKEGVITEDVKKKLRARYRRLLTMGEKECEVNKDGVRQKRTKPQNLLIRLREYEEAVLRFLEEPAIRLPII